MRTSAPSRIDSRRSCPSGRGNRTRCQSVQPRSHPNAPPENRFHSHLWNPRCLLPGKKRDYMLRHILILAFSFGLMRAASGEAVPPGMSVLDATPFYMQTDVGDSESEKAANGKKFLNKCL